MMRRIYVATVTRKFGNSAIHLDKSHDILGKLFFGGLTLGTFCLGIWQTKRYYWKLDLINTSKNKVVKTPNVIPLNLSQKKLSEVFKNNHGENYVLRGRFIHSKELTLGLRTAPAGLLGPQAQGLASNPQGYYIITPMLLQDGNIVYVNRGWTPRSAASNTWTRPEGQVEVVVVATGSEKGSVFSPENPDTLTSKMILWMDVNTLSNHIKSVKNIPPEDVIVTELLDDDSVPLTIFPVARRSHHFQEYYVGPEMHMAYAVTWYSLAFFGSIMTYRMFKGRRMTRKIKTII
mmetsp:Transcript_6000/g.6196  ORF Transcript_6000/g.6196 Transcript_6000/m.6196 type:complete len:290 (+) Transcript_6000:68-937(+)